MNKTPDYYKPDTFNPEAYKRTGWRVSLIEASFDNGKQRLILNVATGRKYWPIFSEVIDVTLGIKDPALSEIKLCMKKYTHPMIDRFIGELELMLSDVYKTEISLAKIELPNRDNNKPNGKTLKL